MTEKAILNWSTHPVKKRTGISILVVLFLFFVWLVVYFTTTSIFLTGLSVVIMLGSMSSFFLPTNYELTQDKIRIKYLFAKREHDWEAYRSFYVDKNGVLLSPFPNSSRLENFRGIYLRFEQNKDQVVDFVKLKIKKPELTNPSSS